MALGFENFRAKVLKFFNPSMKKFVELNEKKSFIIFTYPLPPELRLDFALSAQLTCMIGLHCPAPVAGQRPEIDSQRNIDCASKPISLSHS